MNGNAHAAACTPRHGGGWTGERQVRFLRCLAEHGDVRLACTGIGLSRQSAYKLRGRDPRFAEAWSLAVEAAHVKRMRRLRAFFLERADACLWELAARQARE